MTHNPDSGIPRIDLMGEKAEPAPADTAGEQTPPAVPGRMTMDVLRENYAAILRARAIYYPVAFQFVRKLGQGRQGVVYLGRRQGARGCVTEHAIKVFDPGIYSSPEEYWTDMGRIASQVSRLQQFQSPYVVARHAYDETYGIGYVQMDGIDGLDLRRCLSPPVIEAVRRASRPSEWRRFASVILRRDQPRAALRPGMTVYILRRMLRGLEALHTTNFLHSDVKPDNIMIDRLGGVRLVDFGRAVLVGEHLSFLLGSPMYMAPEIHRREPGSVAADLYSVGLIGLELLRGERLTENPAATEKELLDLKMGLRDRLPELLPPQVRANEALTGILRKTLDPDPAGRQATAREAESVPEGFGLIEKQLVQVGQDSEYGRDLSDYLSKLVDPRTDRIEAAPGEGETSLRLPA